MKVDLKELTARVDKKLISVQKHPEAELWVYNYTQVAQYTKAWDEYTMMARGLILDADGEIIARPFPKFFNLAEHENPALPKVPQEKYDVLEKLDGSLGILYWHAGKPWLATRGSFTSDQAHVGSRYLQEKYPDFVPELDRTYLFEIIYPENRIVVDYAGQQDIILLDVIVTETGKSIGNLNQDDYPFPVVKKFIAKPLSLLLAEQRPNAEGFVIRFRSGMRVKIKHDEYVRLHRLITGVSNKTIWELLSQGKPMTELLDKVPDEFFDWVKVTSIDLEAKYKEIEDDSLQDLKHLTILGFETQKQHALWITANAKHPSIVFAMFNGKDYKQGIWKMIKPTYAKPFTQDIDS